MPDLEAEGILNKYKVPLADQFLLGVEIFNTLDLVVGIEVGPKGITGMSIPRSFLREDPDVPPELEELARGESPEYEGETTFWCYVITETAVYLGYISVPKVPQPKPQKAPKGILLN
jgi:hypothetical protein